ncbi:MAG: hypothetical protein ACYTHK_15365 [Planctomycetota bacterium]|jgi:hypothetical protein
MRVVEERHLVAGGTSESRVARTALRASIDLIVVVDELEPCGRRPGPIPRVHVRGPRDLRVPWFAGCHTVCLLGKACFADRFDAIRRRLEAMR